MRLRLVSKLLLAFGSVACGSSTTGPAAPPEPPARPQLTVGSILTVVSASSAVPVEGATLKIGGVAHTTNAAGRIMLQQAFTFGIGMEIVAPGFLDRLTRLREAASQTYTLWPVDASLPAEYTRLLAYCDTGEYANECGRERPMMRMQPGTVTLRPSDDLRNDPESMALIQEAADLWNEATDERVRLTLAPGAPSTIDVVIDASLPYLGTASRRFRDFSIIGGTINLRGPVRRARMDGFTTRRVVVHEIGHILGLGHSPGTGDFRRDVMFLGELPSPNELMILSLMHQRPPGNEFPDNDAGMSGQSIAEQEVEVVCPDS